MRLTGSKHWIILLRACWSEPDRQGRGGRQLQGSAWGWKVVCRALEGLSYGVFCAHIQKWLWIGHSWPTITTWALEGRYCTCTSLYALGIPSPIGSKCWDWVWEGLFGPSSRLAGSYSRAIRIEPAMEWKYRGLATDCQGIPGRDYFDGLHFCFC